MIQAEDRVLQQGLDSLCPTPPTPKHCHLQPGWLLSFYGVNPTFEASPPRVTGVLPSLLNIPKPSTSEASLSAMEPSSPGSHCCLVGSLLEVPTHEHLLSAYHIPDAVSIQ